jgi:hypothetical protein
MKNILEQGSGPGQIKSDIPGWVKSIVTLDLDRLADEFLSLVITDVSRALSFWNRSLSYVPNNLHGALGRSVNARISLLARGALNNHPEGRALLFRFLIERVRRPSMPKTPFFTPRLAYNYYSSLVTQYGSSEAQATLKRGNLVLLGLRNQSSTLANKGLGSYDDQIVILNGLSKVRTARVFPACTEPGAQYSHRSAPKGKGRVDARYVGIKHHKSDGADINKDGIKDAGRLIEATYKYFEKPGGFLGARAFQVHATQIVERDTDGDGRFTQYDPSRIDTKGAGTSMYIHRGGADDISGLGTWSAGCQTIPKGVYGNFLASIGRPAFFYYVLVNAALV